MIRFLLSALLLIMAAPVAAEWHRDSQDIMGTKIDVVLWHEDETAAAEALDLVMDEMHRINAHYSPYLLDSDLSLINRLAPKASASDPVFISKEMALLLDKSLYYSRITEGAFDITFASLGRYYDYRAEETPSDTQRQELLPAIDYRLVHLDALQPSVYFGRPEVHIDLGGIAKGYAVDRALALLSDAGIEHASVSAGGDTGLIGDRRGRPWMVGIKNPRAPEQVAIVLPLEQGAISTSGDYERYFIDSDGKRVHHIINPSKGTSASGVASASVIGPNAVDTDALSTSVFVLGVDKGLALLESLPGYDGVIISSAGKVHYSSGLQPPEELQSEQ
ncbi:FAD:protein FMN transferase [Marinimicrobium sp. ABcell2]|uniref:FAD:protein FMN transferase n=1 Tax=Marinimicrobium sp. ABcell2 TaxID=3069751 RepID=UPI0027B290C2|nr:FAD:protein FMN transferase [Marinimicrobium sp. ABcell2]MDQ2076652.1 FAD:protein FMN transferase [Marinimicrobium sp. ABcell2]